MTEKCICKTYDITWWESHGTTVDLTEYNGIFRLSLSGEGDYGYTESFSYEINYCPFCGSKLGVAE